MREYSAEASERFASPARRQPGRRSSCAIPVSRLNPDAINHPSNSNGQPWVYWPPSHAAPRIARVSRELRIGLSAVERAVGSILRTRPMLGAQRRLCPRRPVRRRDDRKRRAVFRCTNPLRADAVANSTLSRRSRRSSADGRYQSPGLCSPNIATELLTTPARPLSRSAVTSLSWHVDAAGCWAHFSRLGF